MNIGGKKIPPWALWGGGIGAALVGYLWLKNRGSSSASSSASAIDPVTGLPAAEDNQTDPLTGMTYLAEAEQYGSVSAAEQAGGSYGLAGGYSQYGGTAGYPTSNVGITSSTSQSFATNAAWAQAVTAGLAALGYDSQAVASALGLYFAQHPLTADQASVVQAAIAEYGPPPQGTYPIIPVPSGSTPPPSQTPPPSSGGKPPKPAAPHVSARAVSPTSVQISWNGVPGADSYTHYVTYQGREIGKAVTGKQATSATIGGLTPNHTYTPHVTASGPSGSATGQGPGVKTPQK